MDPGYDSSWSGGYRDLCINLQVEIDQSICCSITYPQQISHGSRTGNVTALTHQIRTEETAALGVDQHVCEVQLLLLAFAEIKVLSNIENLE
jgi:hypothetical protein